MCRVIVIKSPKRLGRFIVFIRFLFNYYFALSSNVRRNKRKCIFLNNDGLGNFEIM